jgi:anti-anti-sigma regulatory factor/HAMP domain-containing protein
LQRADWTVQQLDSWIEEMDDNLEVVARFGDLMELSEDILENRLRELFVKSSPSFKYIGLIDARPGNTGLEIIRVAGPYTITGSEKDYSEESWLALCLEKGAIISDIRFDQAGNPTIVLARAVEQDGQVVAVLAAEADLSWSYDLLRQFNSRERNNHVYVVNEQGQPVLDQRSPFVAKQDGRRDIEAIDAAIRGEGESVFIYEGLDLEGEYVIGAVSSTSRLPWFVIAEQPLSWVIQNLLPLGYGAAGVLSLSILAAAIVGWYVSRRVASPIVRLREGARRIGTGHLEHRIVLRGRNELAELAEEFNRAADSLQESQRQLEDWSRELEERVQTRTAELRQALEQLQQEAEVRETLLQTIREMSSPVIPVMEEVIVIPVVGALSTDRAQGLMMDLLAGVEREQARVVIVDITGLAVVDTAVAGTLLASARAAQLLGAQFILVGISPEVAETLIQLGVEFQTLRTAATLQEGLHLARKLLGIQSSIIV